MNKKYNVYADNRLMQRTTTRLKAEYLSELLTAKGRNGSYASKLKDAPEQNSQIWAFLNNSK